MSSYYSVPNSNVRLKDGMVVILMRFPGTKWVVHNGWYNYNGRNYQGWYFCSIPAQTTMPVNPQDMIGITVVSDDLAPGPGDFPPPGPYPNPYPDDHWGPNPYPPMPPIPYGPKPFHFGKREFEMLNSAFITVENLREFENLDTRFMPDGRIVCINSDISDESKRNYFRWNRRDDKWDEIDPSAIIDEEVSKILGDYYTKSEVDGAIDMVHAEVDHVERDLSDLGDRLDAVNTDLTEKIEILANKEDQDAQRLAQELEIIRTSLSDLTASMNSTFEDIGEDMQDMDRRIDEVENAVFHVQKLSELLSTNTVLVADEGKIKDSGYSIGDSSIDEAPEYAEETVLATEKAVTELVDRSRPKWTQF